MATSSCPGCGLVHEPDPERVTRESVLTVLDEVDAAIEVERRVNPPSWRRMDDLSQFALRIREHVTANWPPDRSVRERVNALLISFDRDPMGGDVQYRFEKLSTHLYLIDGTR